MELATAEGGAIVDRLARRLDEAWESRTPIKPLSESEGLDSTDDAYAIQRRWTELRLERGDHVIGQKIGLTSIAMQEQLGVHEPDYGSLWESRCFSVEAGRATMSHSEFLQPKVEGEFAFLITGQLPLGEVNETDVMAAVGAIAPAVEVIDSRIEDWRIQLVDTIADDASYGGLAIGPWSSELRDTDLRTVGMLVSRNGKQVTEGLGAAALGHPARCVAWLANKLRSYGQPLEPGDIVLSGALARSIPAEKGDTFVVEAHGQPPLTVGFS